MKKGRFLWSAHRITEKQKAGKARNIKEKQLKNSRIDGLLFRRHENKKLLLAGKYPKGTPKRTKEQDITYRNALGRILQTV